MTKKMTIHTNDIIALVEETKRALMRKGTESLPFEVDVDNLSYQEVVRIGSLSIQHLVEVNR